MRIIILSTLFLLSACASLRPGDEVVLPHVFYYVKAYPKFESCIGRYLPKEGACDKSRERVEIVCRTVSKAIFEGFTCLSNPKPVHSPEPLKIRSLDTPTAPNPGAGIPF